MKTHAPKVITVVSSLMVAAGLTLAPIAAHAEDLVLKGSFSTAVASRYVWRGQTLSKGFVAQPTVAVTIGGFSANLWSNVDLDNSEADDDGIVMNETDLTINYTVPIGKLSLTGGFIHYDFDGVAGTPAIAATPGTAGTPATEGTTGSDTQEIYLTAAYATILNPTLSLYYDIDEGKGAFAVLAVSQGIPAGPITLTAGGSIGFNIDDKAMGVNSDGKKFTGLYYGEVSLATSIPLFGKVSLDPRIAYSSALGDHGEHAVKSISADGKKSMLYGSIAVTAAF